MEFLKDLKNWPQDPTAWYNKLITYECHYAALSILCPFTIIAVPSAKFISPIKSLMTNPGYTATYNRVHECEYLGWLFANIDSEQFTFVYVDTCTNQVSSPAQAWAVDLRGIMFKTEADAVMFKLACGEFLV